MVRVAKYTSKEAKKIKGGSDLDRLKHMTGEEIEKAAIDDSDNPLLNDKELKELKPTIHKGDGVYGHDKSQGS